MHIDQRHVTTVNLQDTRAREFVLSRDSWGCKISSVAKDEVCNFILSLHDFCKLQQELVQYAVRDLPRETYAGPGEAAETPAATETVGYRWGSVRVDQRHVTTIGLHPSRTRDFLLARDDRGYKLSSVAKDEVVNILLSPPDFHKLRQQVGRSEWKEIKKDHPTVAEACATETVPADVSAYECTTVDWLGFN